MTGKAFFETGAADIRYVARQLWHSPVFTITVVVTLALAMGANTAIFSVLNAVLLRPLPYSDAARLLAIWHGEASSNPWYSFSYPRFRYFQDRAQPFADLAAYDDEIVTVTDRGSPVRVEGGRVSANFFSVLRIQAELGRSFNSAEDAHGATPVAMLSDRFWRNRYGARRDILGQAIRIDNESFTVIGVLPAAFQFQSADVDVWRSRIVDTRTFAPSSVQSGSSYLTVIARLHPGFDLPQARARLASLARQYSQDHAGNSDVDGFVQADRLQRKLFANLHVTLLVLWGAVLCLLVIACANVANLMLARASARQRDFSIRLALGAGRRRIAQSLITESLLLSFASLLVSIPLSLGVTRALVSALQQTTETVPAVSLDLRIAAVTVGVATLIGIGFGLAPLSALAGAGVSGGLRTQGRGFSGSAWSTALRGALVSAQVAFCLALLVAAGLLARSFVHMTTLRTGLRTGHVLAFPLDLMPDRYTSFPSRIRFFDEVLRRAASLPGIQQAAIADRVDLVSSGLHYLVQPEGAADLGSRNPTARGRSVTPAYFDVVKIPVLRGRSFTERDTAAAPPVTIVNEAFVHQFFPNADPIGKHVTYSTDRISCQIVGVVRDVRESLEDSAADEEFYLPLAQRPWLVAKLLVRTENPAGLFNAIHAQIQAIDPGQAVASGFTLDDWVAETVGRPKMAMSAVSVFAFSALLLAAIGIYGVIAYTVEQQKKQIGIRMALGADSGRVRAMVFGQTVRLLLVGVAAGVPLSLLGSRLYSSLLFEVQPADPWTMLAVVLLMAIVALAASYFPAARAIKVDPIVVLRAD